MEKVKKLKLVKNLGIVIMLLMPILVIVGAGILSGQDLTAEPTSSTLLDVFLVAVFALFIIGIIMFKKSKKALNKLCTACGASLDGCAYNVQEVDRTESNDGRIIAKVEFVADCPECNTEKVLTKKYTVYQSERYDSSGNRTRSAKSFNVERLMKKDADNFFGKRD